MFPLPGDTLPTSAPVPPHTALVVSGGTARGAYAAGLLQALFARFPELSGRIDIFSGTSTGALIVPMLALWSLDPVRHAGLLDLIVRHYQVASTEVFRDEPKSLLWSSVRWLLGLFLGPAEARMVAMLGEVGAVLDPSPLKRTIETEFTDARLEELFGARDRVQCIVNCVSLQRGSVVTFSSADPKMTCARFRDAIYASCIQPVFMPVATVTDAEGKTEEYLDGGIRDVVPFYSAWRAGATRAVALSLYPDDPSSRATSEHFAGRAQLLALAKRVVVDLLDGEVGDDDVLQARYLSTIGKAVGLAKRLGASTEEMSELLSGLDAEERAHFEGPTVFDHLLVHRPAPDVPLVEAFRWDADGMRASIEAGQAVAKGETGTKIRDFVLAPA